MPAMQFLHRINMGAGVGTYVATDTDRLRRAAFLDGRERFWDGEAVRSLPDRVEDWRPAYVFHMSFCGSTLLATLLDRPGSVLALKEPHALVDIADAAHGAARLATTALAAFEQSAGEAGAGEAVVVKPSNWANNLIPLLCSPERGVQAVFVRMPAYDFLRAVFRGGRDRMAYTMRAAEHLLGAAPATASLYRQAIAGSRDPYRQVARTAALLHLHQQQLFDAAIAANGWAADRLIDFDALQRHPAEVTQHAAALLGIAHDLRRAATAPTAHAKDHAARYSAEREQAHNREVERHHHDSFRHALDWLSSATM
ncbi:hypothetical protein Q5H91_09845 [Sphingomonas sp. KR1UV-12]|uniref:Sulfotransferase family protein n=1 Tax=Sphingomonas aurea TaxID=3063994 RepID=A0ABT9EKQ2_9SPHN|nr:hypothetical protein [Sphingomonas sp. KR1UV-12]MDP1027514.1 hypothetical protein [Sphingomonas sp. KR1UV-12]